MIHQAKQPLNFHTQQNQFSLVCFFAPTQITSLILHLTKTVVQCEIYIYIVGSSSSSLVQINIRMGATVT